MARITEKVDKQKHPMASQLEDEVVWMAGKLEETRRLIANTPVVIKYDNGGGQAGIRRNPAYDGYIALFKSFVKGVAALDEMMKDTRYTSSDGLSAIERLRQSIEKTRQEAMLNHEELGFTVKVGGE